MVSSNYSCINAVQNRACRFYLGVGRYAPTDGVLGDLRWVPVSISQKTAALRQWRRYMCMDNNRLNKRMLLWADKYATTGCKNWNFKIRKLFRECDCSYLEDAVGLDMVRIMEDMLFSSYKRAWAVRTDENTGKLRTYKTVKSNGYHAEHYVTSHMPRSFRSAMAKFRLGVAPIRLETGRYERLPVEQRLCQMCENRCAEDENHVILKCPFYDDLRYSLVKEAEYVCSNFSVLSDAGKFEVLFTHVNLTMLCAKTCFNILRRRRWCFYK